MLKNEKFVQRTIGRYKMSTPITLCICTTVFLAFVLFCTIVFKVVMQNFTDLMGDVLFRIYLAFQTISNYLKTWNIEYISILLFRLINVRKNLYCWFFFIKGIDSSIYTYERWSAKIIAILLLFMGISL